MNQSLFNSICYTVGWFWCVLFGIHGRPIIACSGAIFLIFIQLYLAKSRHLKGYIEDLILVFLSVPLGVLLEVFFIQINLIHYLNSSNLVPPIWIISLYPLFSLLLNHSLFMIRKNYLLPFSIGLMVAPLSYMAGESLGGLVFPFPLIPTWIILGISWGVFLCLLTKLANTIEKAAEETFQDWGSRQPGKLFFDGDCPICKREVCLLQKIDHQTHINFVDIASDQFLSEEHGRIEYETAMKQIHALDGDGNLLVGLPAFAFVYARCQFFLLSTLLRIPLIKIFLNPVYKLFAKNRLWMTGRK